MTDSVTIFSPNFTNIPSTITIAPSTNMSVYDIAATINGNTTNMSAAADAPMPIWVGFIGCLVATVFFGSNLVPVKQFSAGDGFFFQFVFCTAVYVVGIIVDLVIGNQRFYPLVLIGGNK
jgi:hypothetical protein